jgi:5-methyltetrahydrofolate--homocysteine methyltransferase
MARTIEHKLEAARRLFEIVVERCGLPPSSLYIDPLVFALPSRDASWAGSAIDTMEALRRIKETWPEVRTMVGISDVSFGLPLSARKILNAVFLHHCTEAGLDAAIVEPTDVRPYADLPPGERTLADAVLFNRAPDAIQRFGSAFA